MTNIYVENRLRWEQEQARLHGCRYENGRCVLHNAAKAENEPEPQEPKPQSAVELPLICNCRSFTHPHEISAHAELESEHDWRTPAERTASAARKIAPVNAERATAYPWFERSTRKGE